MSIRGGYTSNKAFGSLVNLVQNYDNQFGVRGARQKDGSGFALGVNFQQMLSEPGYLKFGLNYLQKQVNPEEGSYPLYKDSLKTGYLSLPLLIGIMEPLNLKKTIFLSAEAGPSGNFKLIDKSWSGPDRVSFRTSAIVLGFQAGAGITLVAPSGVRWLFQYSYMRDITKAYTESLYIGTPTNPTQTFEYKFSTQIFSIELQWPL